MLRNMIEKIRAAFYKNALAKLLLEQKRPRKIHTLQSAGKIGVLFDAGSAQVRKEVLELTKTWEKEGKKVQLLGFFNSKQVTDGESIQHFSLKESTWQGKSKSEKATAFSQEKFDLLLVFNPEALAPLHWVAVASQAAMKIGTATKAAQDFDFQLEIPDGKGVRFFAEQLHIYLDKIVLTKS